MGASVAVRIARLLGFGPLAAVILLAACSQGPSELAAIRARGEIRVVTLNTPTCYYLGSQGTEGLEFELARNFAAQLGVRLTMYAVGTERAMQAELLAGRADIAAAQLTASGDWRSVAEPAEPYSQNAQFVVYRRDGVRPRGTLQIESAKLAVRAGSPQEEMLKKLHRTLAPQLQWIGTAPTSADPLEDVDSGDADYALIDAREFSFARHLYPDVLVGFALPDKRPVQWMIKRGAPDLLEAANRFFRAARHAGLLASLETEESGDNRPFQYEESREFQVHLMERLPRYRGWFEAASTQTGIDWRLLAAIGYQESKWDPTAVSGDGALGVMMLTSDTATAMGIKDRTNPEDNIAAGARYLAEVRAKVPERIPEPDRTWLTVAAYNVGFGHLEDARILAQMKGKNPDSWADVREELPLLAQERWYQRVKRGYARGWEPVQFVDRVQRYLRLLEWQPGDGVAGGDSVTRIAAPGA
ncbi:MAG TPA: membrane-bound lytic murein transglycosylase MltF [Steroidobacteraceae bacterium]|nr:membrane-bound lytic murein transglycosylase MltF [Steroidobacteraceae bacterium]